MFLSRATRYSPNSGAEYFAEDFHPNLLRAAGFSPPAWYQGRAKHLILPSVMSPEHFVALLSNRHPLTKERITPRDNAKGDTSSTDRRCAYELALGVPKTVSIMALVAGDRRIVTAYEIIAYEIMMLAACYAQTRVRRHGFNEKRSTGHLIGVLFTHLLSRALDPHLHGHLVFPNLTFDPVENRFKALEFSEIVHWLPLLQNWAAAQMRHQLLTFGYRLLLTGGNYEIEGVDSSLVQRFSQSQAAIVKAVAKREAQRNEHLGPAARKNVALSRRPQKQRIGWGMLQSNWRSKAGAHYKRLVELRREAESRSTAAIKWNPRIVARSALQSALPKLSEKFLAFSTEMILTHTLEMSTGLWHGRHLEAAIEEAKSNGGLVPLRPNSPSWGLPATMRRFNQLVEILNLRSNAVLARRAGSAIERVVAAKDPVLVLRASPSLHCRRAVKALLRAFRGSGHAVVPVAPSNASGGKRFGFQAGIRKVEALSENSRAILLVGQAEKLTLGELEDLTIVAGRNQARVLLITSDNALEDSQDLRPAVALQHYSWIKTISLLPPRPTREAKWRRDKARGFLATLNRLLSRNPKAIALLPKAKQPRGITALAFANAVDGTNLWAPDIYSDSEQVVARVNERLHQLTLDAAAVAPIAVDFYSHLAAPLSNGCLLAAPTKTFHFNAGDLVSIEKIDAPKIQVRFRGECIKRLSPKAISKLKMVKKESTKITAGVQLILTEPYRPLKLAAGDVIRVAGVDSSGALHLDTGEVIPQWFRFFGLGYCRLLGSKTRKQTVRALVLLSRNPTKTTRKLLCDLADRVAGDLQLIVANSAALPSAIVDRICPDRQTLSPHLRFPVLNEDGPTSSGTAGTGASVFPTLSEETTPITLPTHQPSKSKPPELNIE